MFLVGASTYIAMLYSATSVNFTWCGWSCVHVIMCAWSALITHMYLDSVYTRTHTYTYTYLYTHTCSRTSAHTQTHTSLHTHTLYTQTQHAHTQAHSRTRRGWPEPCVCTVNYRIFGLIFAKITFIHFMVLANSTHKSSTHAVPSCNANTHTNIRTHARTHTCAAPLHTQSHTRAHTHTFTHTHTRAAPLFCRPGRRPHDHHHRQTHHTKLTHLQLQQHCHKSSYGPCNQPQLQQQQHQPH